MAHLSITEMLAHAAANAGGTYRKVGDLFEVVTHADGFQVALPDFESVTPSLSEAFVKSVADAVDAPYVGLWQDAGQWFADVSEHISDAAEAIRVGRERAQLAVWDWANGSSLYL